MGIATQSSAAIALLAVLLSFVDGKSLTQQPTLVHSNDTDQTSIEHFQNDKWTSANPKDFRYLALIETNIAPNNKYCLGAIIHDEWILTATGCSRIWYDPDRYTIIVGLGLKDSKRKRYDVKHIKLHPDYPGDNYSNHLVLIKTTKSMSKSKLVKPIELNRKPITNEVNGIIARTITVSGHLWPSSCICNQFMTKL